MGTPHGRSGPSTLRTASPHTARGQVVRTQPRSLFSSLTGLISGVKHTAYRGVNSFFDSMLSTKATQRRSSGAVTKTQAARSLARRQQRKALLRRDTDKDRANRRRGQLALEYLADGKTDDSTDTERSSESSVEMDSGYISPEKEGKRRRSLASSSEKENDLKKSKTGHISSTDDDDRIAALERKIAYLEARVLATSPATTSSYLEIPPPPPPPPLSCSTGSHLVPAAPPPPRPPAPPPARDPRFNTAPHALMRRLLEEMKVVKLRRTDVLKSPGGTIRSNNFRDHDRDEEPDENDHQNVIAHALRRKFRSIRADSTDATPEDTPQRDTEWDDSEDDISASPSRSSRVA